MPGSGEQGERCGVAGSHDPKVPMIKGGDLGCVQSLSHRDHRGVDHAQGKIGIGGDQFGHAEEVAMGDGFELQLAIGQLGQEAPFGGRTHGTSDHEGGLCEHQRRNDEGTTVDPEQRA